MAITDSDLSSFGALLKLFRTRRHFTQQQLAEAIGVHRNAIGRWEQGNFLPQHKGIVLELARHLHLDDQEARRLLEASLTAPVPVWNIPFSRNAFFTGREEILVALHRALGVDQAVALTQSSALHGLGGVGKTQIALEYAYRHALEYRAVFWIAAETDESIVTSLLRLAEVLRLPERDDKDQQRVVAAVQQWLSTHGQWLVIWDNVEDLELLDRFLPSLRQGAMLITTRCQILGTLVRGMDLLPMEQEEGTLFLLRRAKVLSSEATGVQMHQFAARMPAQYAAAVELVTVLGGLPLALDQAGAYMEETRCGLSAYLDLWRTQRAVLLQQRGEGVRDHPASVSTTLTLAILATAERHPAVQDLLRVCALLQVDTIPEELFRQGGEQLGAPLATACHDSLSWDRVVGVACSYSLLSRHPEEQTLSIHRLVQAVLLDAMTDEEREKWSTRVIAMLEVALPEVRHATEYAAWKQCERLLPHALLCVRRAGVASPSLPLASLAHKTAYYLLRRGRYTEAEPLVRHALQIREQALGPVHPEVAAPLHGLANLYRDRSHYPEAEPLFRRALSLREQHLGQYHPDTAETLHDLAILRQKQGNLSEALSLAQRTLSIRSQALGDAHPKTVASRALYAQLVQEQADVAEKTATEQEGEAMTDACNEACQADKAPLSQHKGVDAFSSASDLLQAFLDACCSQHPRAWCRSADLWLAYKEWTEKQQERYPLSRRTFIEQLQAHGCCADRTKRARIWRGIALVNTNDDGG